MLQSLAPALTVVDSVPVNGYVWIRSLPPEDLGPSLRMVEEVESLALRHGQSFRLIEVSNRSDLAAALLAVAQLASKGLRPIIQIDAHGTADRGVLLAPSGEYAPWSEVIEKLRAINVATRNNLICIFGLCFGLHLYKLVEPSKAAPAYLFIAPENAISSGELEDATIRFYRHLAAHDDLTQACDLFLSPAMRPINCQRMLFLALVRYIQTHCRGYAKRTRQEKVVTQMLQTRGWVRPNRNQLRSTRATVKSGLKPGPHIIKQFAAPFLLDRPPGFTYADLARAAGLANN